MDLCRQLVLQYNQGLFVCLRPLAAVTCGRDRDAESWGRVLDKVFFNSGAIFRTNPGTSESANALTIPSPPRAPCASLGGWFSVITESQGDRPYPNP